MTEVQHGPSPTFRRQITGDGYELKIVGYNTRLSHLTSLRGN